MIEVMYLNENWQDGKKIHVFVKTIQLMGMVVEN